MSCYQVAPAVSRRPGQNPRAARRDRDGVLEMRRVAAIGGHCGPVIPQAPLRPGRRVTMGSMAKTMPTSSLGPGRPCRNSGRWVLVHLRPDAVADEFAATEIPLPLHHLLHGGGNVAEVVAGTNLARCRVSSESRVTRRSFSRSGRYLADRHGNRRVAEVSVGFDAEVEDIAFFQLVRRRGNAVHNFLVDRRHAQPDPDNP